jgi:hypothetical protein
VEERHLWRGTRAWREGSSHHGEEEGSPTASAMDGALLGDGHRRPGRGAPEGGR